MAEIVLQMIPFGLENIVVFVLALPTGTPILDNRHHIRLGEDVIGSKGIVIELTTIIFASNRDFTPIDIHGIFITSQRHVIDKAKMMLLSIASVPVTKG